MDNFKKLNDFCNRLSEKKIYFRLSKIREEYIMVEVDVPCQKWEIEFMEDGSVEVEKFISNGHISGEEEIEVLFKEFSD